MALSLLTGCADVLGLNAYGSGGAGTTGSGGTTSSGGTGGTGGTTSSGGTGETGGTTSSGGTGGTGGTTSSGGTGGTTSPTCAKGDQQPCYDGPAGTEGKGACHAGASTCDDAGNWGPCEGQVLPAIEICSTGMVDESCDEIASCTGQYRWAKVFGDGATQAAAGVAVDSRDNVVLAATVQGSTDLGGGARTSVDKSDVLVAELGPGGEHVWSQIFGDAGNQSVSGVAVSPGDGVVLVGTFEGSLAFGNLPALTSAGKTDIFVAKLDSAGQPVWAKSFGGAEADTGAAVSVDTTGEVFVIGSYQGAFMVNGTALTTPDVADNVFVAKLAADTGDAVWGRGFGVAGAQTGRAIVADPVAGLFIAVDVAVGLIGFGCAGAPPDAGGGDIVLARLSKDAGACAWVKRYGDAAAQNVVRLVPSGDGGVVAGGHVFGTVDFGLGDTFGNGTLDAAVWKVDGNGNTQWAVRPKEPGGQYVWGLAAEKGGNVVVAGSFAQTLDFSGGQGGVLTAQTAYDRYVVKLGPDGSHLWSRSYARSGNYTMVAIDSLGRIDLEGDLAGVTDLGGGEIGVVGGTDLNLLVGQLAP